MKKLLIGIALGTIAGMIVGEMPEVQNLMQKKKKECGQMVVLAFNPSTQEAEAGSSI